MASRTLQQEAKDFVKIVATSVGWHSPGSGAPDGNGRCHYTRPGGVAFAARLGGWKPDGRHAYVKAEGCRFQLLASGAARGLGFDAVVVMEPAAFRASSGTGGRLYTSLMRANLVLVDVHDKPLPVALTSAAKTLQSTSNRPPLTVEIGGRPFLIKASPPS